MNQRTRRMRHYWRPERIKLESVSFDGPERLDWKQVGGYLVAEYVPMETAFPSVTLSLTRRPRPFPAV